MVPFDGLDGGRAGLAAALAAPGFTYLYWDGVDFTGHMAGPSSAAFDEAARGALDMIDAAIRDAPPGTRLLVTADHGQVDVDPARVDALDALWPELVEHLRRDDRGRPLPRPARRATASCTSRPAVRARSPPRSPTGSRTAPRCAWSRTSSPTGCSAPSDRGCARGSPTSASCPRRAGMAWLAAFPGPERHFHGHHGGLEAAERETWVGTLPSSYRHRSATDRKRHGAGGLSSTAVGSRPRRLGAGDSPPA